MNIRKIAPVAIALTMAATVSAGATYDDVNCKYQCKYQNTVHCYSVSNDQWKWVQEICKEYGLDCDWNGSSSKPETKPEDKPEENLPETKPEDKPEENLPETKPEDKPEENLPETKPEDKPEENLPETKPEDKPEENLPETKPEDKPETNLPETKPEDKPETNLPETKPEQTPDTSASQSSFAAQVVKLVNAERAKAGLSSVTVDTKVQKAAQVRATEQAKVFSHTRPNGTSCFTALSEAGVNYRGAGENIAYGQTTPQAVMTAWMNSSGHRANILNQKFTKIGVGYTVINGVPYWAQMFTY